MQHDLQLLPKRMCFFAVEHIDVLMFGFGCWGETAESAKNVMFVEIRPNILWSYTAVWCHDSGWFHCSWVCSARKVPTQQLVDRCVFRPCRSLQTDNLFSRTVWLMTIRTMNIPKVKCSMTCSCFPNGCVFLQWNTLTFWCLGLAAEGRLPRAPRMWCSLKFDQTSFACLHQIWSGVVAVLRICLHVSNAEILGTAQRFATAAPIKECSNEPLKIITGVRTVVISQAKLFQHRQL